MASMASSVVCRKSTDVFFKTGFKWTLYRCTGGIRFSPEKILKVIIFVFILLDTSEEKILEEVLSSSSSFPSLILDPSEGKKSCKFYFPYLHSPPWSSLHCEYNPELGFVVSEAETSRAELRRPLAIVHIVLPLHNIKLCCTGINCFAKN